MIINSKSTPPTLRVVIPTHGRATLLARTLTSLAACELPESYAETIVVENGGRDGADEIVAIVSQKHPALRLRYLHVERANKSHALNVALKSLDDGLIVFFDDDVRLRPDVLQAYSVAASRSTSGHFFGGSTLVDYEEQPPEWLRPALPLCAKGLNVATTQREWHLFLGFNWAAFAADVHALGGFSSEFGPGSVSGATGQEADMQERMLARGFVSIDVPDATVWHYVPKERSTVRWVLARNYRGGLERGIRARADGVSAVASFGTTFRSAGAVVKRTLLMDRPGRTLALRGLWGNWGFLRGYFRRQDSAAKE